MNAFFSDPSHIWLAVLVSTGTTVAATMVFALIVHRMLGQFLAAQEKVLARATIQATSIDGALSYHSGQLRDHAEKIAAIQKGDLERDGLLEQLGGRLRVVEDRRVGQVG